MSLSNSRKSYDDCFKLLDAALDEARGIRVEVASTDVANYLRMRIHHARSIDRSDNAKTYTDPDHPLHGRSEYDALVCRIEPANGHAWLWLDKQKVEIGRIERIEEGAQIAAPEPVLMIEGPKVSVEEFLKSQDTTLYSAVPIPVQIRRR